MNDSVKRRAKKVAVCVSLNHASERDFLSGIFTHLDMGYRWKLQIIQSSPPFSAESLKKAEEEGFDGIIISDAKRTDLIPELVTTSIPLAIISGTAFQKNHPLVKRGMPTVAIHNDNQAISEIALKHILSCGKFNSFGFVPAARGIVWSEERLSGFANALSAKGYSTSIFDNTKSTLGEWLLSLQKPAAVMAACDEIAIDVLEACEAAKLNIPKQVAVIGVDNDEFLCRHSTPPLSSVLPGHEEMGYRASVELERLMSPKCTKANKITHITIAPRKVVLRDSTKRISPSAMLVGKIKAQILSEATNGANVADIVRKVGVSRRLAELRFREVEGKTIADALATRRLEEALRLIRTSKRTFVQIAQDCGFYDAKHLTHRFTKAFGISPRAFRMQRKED